jgi:hypothetical protein
MSIVIPGTFNFFCFKTEFSNKGWDVPNIKFINVHNNNKKFILKYQIHDKFILKYKMCYFWSALTLFTIISSEEKTHDLRDICSINS